MKFNKEKQTGYCQADIYSLERRLSITNKTTFVNKARKKGSATRRTKVEIISTSRLAVVVFTAIVYIS